MLADLRSYILFSFFLSLFTFSAGLKPAQAQINGVPASVTSLGFGGNQNPTPGVRASVTSLGQNRFGNGAQQFERCCANFFLPQNTTRPLPAGHHHRGGQNGRSGRDRGRGLPDFLVGIPEPVYVPYAVPYDESAEDDSADPEYANVAEARQGVPPLKSAMNRDRISHPDESAKLAVENESRPITAQPATVLIFKDGHQADVMNYAIVGDTLFDLSAGRSKKILLADIDLAATQKVNDDRGVDFRTPSHSAGQ